MSTNYYIETIGVKPFLSKAIHFLFQVRIQYFYTFIDTASDLYLTEAYSDLLKYSQS